MRNVEKIAGRANGGDPGVVEEVGKLRTPLSKLDNQSVAVQIFRDSENHLPGGEEGTALASSRVRWSSSERDDILCRR